MTAAKTVPQFPHGCNSAYPSRSKLNRTGVLTLFGYGINVRVDRGHLVATEANGSDSRSFRFPRTGHNLRRLVILGSDGAVSLAALRWLADQNASFVMLERNGSVLFATGPLRSYEVRIRRAQALAHTTSLAVDISRDLIDRKLAGQEQIARTKLKEIGTAEAIARWRLQLPTADSIEAIRFVEAQGAYVYWSAFRNISVRFPERDLVRVPQHWRTFGQRQSPITGSPRMAVNPAQAMLNYLYAVLESETRIATNAVGLDPGLGFVHADTVARDNLLYDLMEPIRPAVDGFVLDLVRQPLNRDWFFEVGNGNCRLMPHITTRLSETALNWSRLVAPVTEAVVRQLWSTSRQKADRKHAPTHLTQAHRASVKGVEIPAPTAPKPNIQRLCGKCGSPCGKGDNCPACLKELCREEMIEIAQKGRLLAVTPEANAKRVEKQAKQWAARSVWNPESQPEWLTEHFYSEKVQPRLRTITVPRIAAALGVSEGYAADIRAGRHKPHERHWNALAALVNVTG